MTKSSWREMILDEMKKKGDSWEHYQGSTFANEAEFDKKFDTGFGGSCGRPFTLWTATRVYFPVVYDGAEWVGSVPRHPCKEASQHHGGQ